MPQDEELALNMSRSGIRHDDPSIITDTERTVHKCRNRTTEEKTIKCFQQFLNGLCRRTNQQSINQCITACKVLRKFSPDHWNAHEKCIYPQKPCAKEHSVYRVQKSKLSQVQTSDFECRRCEKR